MNRLYVTMIAALALNAAAPVHARMGQESARAEKTEALISVRIDDARAQAAPRAPHHVSDPNLVRIARARADTLAHGAPFSHRDDTGRTPVIDMVTARFGRNGTIGENLALETGISPGFAPDALARRVVDGWMASGEHRWTFHDRRRNRLTH